MNWKIWILIIAILASILALFPFNFKTGIEIASVPTNSTAYEAGLRTGDIITAADGKSVSSIDDYSAVINNKFPSDNETKLTITTNHGDVILFTKVPPQVSVKNIEKTRIKTGLDLSGGARALVRAEEKDLSASELNDLISVTSQRLNVYGLKDIQIRPVTDLSGKNFVLIEIAGSTPQELEALIGQQGKFEAKIGNETVFNGGDKDVTYVARTGSQAGIYGCSNNAGTVVCNFQFAISLSEKAAERQAALTQNLGISTNNTLYLDKQIDLYLDGQLLSSLYISRDLRGQKATQISISGSGTGATSDEAYKNAISEMNKLQTILITGSLPYKLKIEKLDTISPLLGKKFIDTILIAGVAAMLAVSIIIFLRYRNIKLSLAVLFTSFSEIIIILGVSALFKQNLDLPSIAGIIATIGTGVDSQIIILDESKTNTDISLKERVKRALHIILGSYLTVLFALLPLIWAGAGLLKGFAITSILGISIGVFISRPAFSEIVKNILKD